MKKAVIIAAVLAAVLNPLVWPQSDGTATSGITKRLSDAANVSLITILPGDALYSAFGHSAIRIEDPANGMDLLFNYGQSEVPFDAAFVPRFLGGSMRFVLGVADTGRAFSFYREVEDRTILSQQLLIDPADKRKLFRLLTENALPENRGYLYDFFSDNCATRIRNILEAVLGERLSLEIVRTEPLTFREEIAPYLSGKPYLAAGIDLLLGPGADRVPDGREVLFLPRRLMEATARAKFLTSGIPGPLAGQAVTLYESSRTGPAFTVPLLLLWFLPAAALLLPITPGVSRRTGRIFDVLLFGFAGFVGSSLLFLWLVSGYEATAFNLNLIWGWPLHLVFAAALPVKRNPGRRLNRLRRIYGISTAVLTFLFLIAIPFLPQSVPSGLLTPILSAIIIRSVRLTGSISRIERLRALP